MIDVREVEFCDVDFDAGLAVDAERGGRHGLGSMAEKLCAFDVVDGGVWEFLADSLKDGDGVSGLAIVIAEQDLGLIGQGADDRDLEGRRLERQHAVVFE